MPVTRPVVFISSTAKDLPEHREAAAKAARQAGFEICYSRYFDLLGVVPWWLRFRLLKADGLSVHAVQTYDRFGVPLMKLLDRAHGPPIGKNVIMVARRVT